MGDNFAQQLFETLQRSSGAPPKPFQLVTWRDLTPDDHTMWQEVARFARARIASSIRAEADGYLNEDTRDALEMAARIAEGKPVLEN